MRMKFIDVVRQVCGTVSLYEADGRHKVPLAVILGRSKWDRLWYVQATYGTFEDCAYSLLEQMGYEPALVSLRSCFVPYPQKRTDYGYPESPELAEVFPAIANIRSI